MGICLSIVVPLYNKEESVEKLIDRIVETGKFFDFTYEIILVDDGSTYKTWYLVEQRKGTTPQLRGVKLRGNYGQASSAMVAGFDNAKGEVIVTIDGDLQNDPADIPKLLEKMDGGMMRGMILSAAGGNTEKIISPAFCLPRLPRASFH